MKIVRGLRYWKNQVTGRQRPVIVRFFVAWMIISAIMPSCKTEPHSSSWFDENSLTIGQYLKKNKKEYSKFYQLLDNGKMMSALYAYNPRGDGYTLFLPTDAAIDHFIQQNRQYGSFEELARDTSFVKRLTRYHVLKRKLRTHEFPDGALIDSTLTGDRLVASFFAVDNNQLIKINNVAQIIRPNLDMSNGCIHVISEVLKPIEVSGYDWLQQQNEFTILSRAMELSGIQRKLNWDKYTLFAEPDSIYRRYGINTVEDLISRIASPDVPLSAITNSFYQFTSYHILKGEYYMNDFHWGSKEYFTLSDQLMTISIGQVIRINTGIDTYGITVSASGDTTEIDYIRPILESCNIPTRTGPVHPITDLMYYKPLPAESKQ